MTNDKRYPKHLRVINRKAAEAFLKKMGFKEGDTPGDYHRANEPTPAEEEAGITGFEWVYLPALLTNFTVWVRFVRRWTRLMGGHIGRADWK